MQIKMVFRYIIRVLCCYRRTKNVQMIDDLKKKPIMAKENK